MKLYFWTKGWGWLLFGIGYKAKWFFGLSVAEPSLKLKHLVYQLQINYPKWTEVSREEYYASGANPECKRILSEI